MKIAILFPGKPHIPGGGYKIVLEYANRFIQDGYDVQILYPIYCYGKRSIWRRIYDVLRYIKFRNTYSINMWFPLNPKIKESVLADFKNLPDADIYIATAVETAIALNKAKKNIRAKCFYFIQNFETWIVTREKLLETYHYPFTKIAISPHLIDAVTSEGEECHFAPNGFDPREYKMSIPIEEKEGASVSLLYHTLDTKDFKTGFQALKIAHEKHPELKALIFGAYPCTECLPDWCEFYYNPDNAMHNEINNRAAIYLGPSQMEGFCLTIGEAMMCGQAIVCTDIPGYTVIARHNENSLVSAVGDAQALADNIIKLIDNPELRIQLAHAGHKLIADYTYDKAYARFKNIIETQSKEMPQA